MTQCPFCGSTNLDHFIVSPDFENHVFAECNDCGKEIRPSDCGRLFIDTKKDDNGVL